VKVASDVTLGGWRTMKPARSALAVVVGSIGLASCFDGGSTPMKEFGLVGTWADDCAKPGSLHLTFADGSSGKPTITMVAQNSADGNGTLYFEVVSASKITDEKLKVMTVVTGKDDTKLPRDKISSQQPSAGVFEIFGKKIKMDNRIMEKCLN
jgi:hypothetical protein